MADQEFFERAKRALRLVRTHQHLRDVADEVTVIRECLAMAASSPIALGVTDADLVEMVRNGYMAEARIIFDLACDKAASSIEKDFFFSELVSLVVRATVASRPSEAPARAAALLAEPARTVQAKAEDPLAEIERLKAERGRLAAELRAADEKLDKLRREQDEKNAALLAQFDPSNGLVPFAGLAQLSGTGEGVDDLDFDGAFGGEPSPLATPILPAVTATKIVAIEGSDVTLELDDGHVIELTTEDIESEEDPDPVIEVVCGPISADEACILRFFGEKDAIALGLLFPLTNIRPRARTTPPPLPRRDEHA
ncbi:MAG TPA: hypothetical protein VL426_01375 [Candidatus Binatia bacterium]|jgi:hypothetical protein|nr:hypothetical protein [Candidatus Binatia bacterium]